MTSFRPFHRWIQPTSTADTVVLAFGGWWDADAAGGITAAIDAALPAMSAEADATVEHAASIDGSLPALTADAAAVVEHRATITASLPALTADAAVAVEHFATIDATLPALTADVAVTATSGATIDANLPALQAELAATVEHFAAIDAALPELSANVTITTTSGTVIDANLPPLEAELAATVEHSATIDATLPGVTSTATAVVEHHATISSSLPALVADVAMSIDQGTELVRRAINAGYPFAGGWIALVVAPGEEGNIAALIAASRGGWTFAEAVAVTMPTRNASWRIIGDPLARLALPKQGYNVYSRATPGGEDELIAVNPAGDTSIDLTGFDAGSEQWISVAAVSRLGLEDDEPHDSPPRMKRVRFDAAGNLIVPAPNRPIDPRIEQLDGGVVRLQFSYRANGQEAAPVEFRVYVAEDADPFDLNNPTHTIPAITGRANYTQSLGAPGGFAHGTIVRVQLSSASGSAGDGSEAFAPAELTLTIDTLAPDAPASLTVEVTNE